MTTTQVVIITILCICEMVALSSLIRRMAELDDNLWIEPVVMLILGLFIYLVAR